MLSLKQLIPPSTCLHCQICCRFPEKNTVWQPRLSKSEILAFTKKRWLATKIKKGTIDSKIAAELFCCSFLNHKKNSCRIYKIRPFDCQLYPFVLTGAHKKVILAVHLVCPFIEWHIRTRQFRIHVGYLKKFFAKKDTRDFLKENPAIIQDYQTYSKELIPLFPLAS